MKKGKGARVITYLFTVLEDEQERNRLHTLPEAMQNIWVTKNPINADISEKH